MKPGSPPARILRGGVLSGCATLAVATVAYALTSMRNPLYGDPAHANISGMWNPEFSYFGPPVADPAAAARTASPAGPGGFPRKPPDPQLTPPYAQRYAEWRRKFAEGKQDPDTVTRCLAFGIARFGTMPVEII